MNQEHEEYFKELFINIKNKYLLEWDRGEINKSISGDQFDREFEDRQRHIILRLKGREKYFIKKIDSALERIKDETRDISKVELDPKLEGRQAVMILTPEEKK